MQLRLPWLFRRDVQPDQQENDRKLITLAIRQLQLQYTLRRLVCMRRTMTHYNVTTREKEMKPKNCTKKLNSKRHERSAKNGMLTV